jgi:DNA (cytosine-5)-methyltransferase 1
MDKKVIELFAGVGGFRVGLNNVTKIGRDGKAIEKGDYTFVWSNQWEPATKEQHAFDCYVKRFGKDGASNEDIGKVDKKSIPDHTLLVGGFPCQDYSVARTLSSEKGIEGKKGVLWWQINDILKAKKPAFVLLENVDRLLKSPAKQRGRDFGIMLRCFSDAGYGVQWRVINAGEYGHPQRRRRTFIFGFRNDTHYYHQFVAATRKDTVEQILSQDLMFSDGFKCDPVGEIHEGNVGKDDYPTLIEVSDKFASSFENAGFCLKSSFTTGKVTARFSGHQKTLGQQLQQIDVPDSCYHVNVEKFRYLKGGKHINRTAKNGHEYVYSEGPIPFPDNLDTPSRTMLTSEGSTNRSTHFILDPLSGHYRILTPIECERLDEFPDDWTNTGMPTKRRYFIAGNALVTGLIKTMGRTISKIIDKENN